MSRLRSEPRVEGQADLAGSRLALRIPGEQELRRQPREIESAVDLPLRNLAMWPTTKRSDTMRPLSGRMVEGEHRQGNRHKRSSSGDFPRPKSSGRRVTTGDRTVLSRSKGGVPVVRRVNSSHGPKAATVQDVTDMESTLAVDSYSGTEDMCPEPEPDRINSTTFLAKTAVTTEVGKILSGQPTDEVDPMFLSELSQHENHRTKRAMTPMSACSQRSSTLVHSSSDSKSSPDTLLSRNRRHSVRPTEKWSHRSNSSSSSNGSASQRSLAGTVGTTPDLSATGDREHIGLGVKASGSPPAILRTTRPAPEIQESQGAKNSPKPLEAHSPGWRYGTPEMARGSVKLPVLSPDELQPRPVIPGLGYPKHLPRAEKLPMSGYELLASKLSTSGSRPRPVSAGLGSTTNPAEKRDATIKPIYRRFEALNHRLLLHLQDELSELEEQLHRLDTADTQTRRLQNSILPASRRAESVAAGELQWHKTDILSRIGSKLNQYNQALSSFSETQHLPPARMPDIEVYRSFLTTQNPIAEIETHFLDTAEDLVSLVKSPPFVPPYLTSSPSPSIPSPSGEPGSDDVLSISSTQSTGNQSTPVSPASRKSSRKIEGLQSPVHHADEPKSTVNQFATTANNYPVGQAAIFAALAVLLPMVVFRIMTVDFASRMAVVLVVGLLVAALRRSLGDAGFWIGGPGKMSVSAADVGTVVCAYGVVMGLVAVLF